MIKFFSPLAVLLLALLATPVQAQAEVAAPAVSSSPYAALVDTIVGGVDRQDILRRTITQIRDALVNDNPDFVVIEKKWPGTTDEIVKAMIPALERHTERLGVQYRREVAALIEQALTADEAREAAAFYGSPLGRRMMGKVSDNYSVSAVASEAASGDPEAPISIEAVKRDSRRTTARALQALSSDDLAAIERELAGKEWLLKFSAIQPKMTAVRATMENAPMNPEDEAEITAAVTKVLETRMVSEN